MAKLAPWKLALLTSLACGALAVTACGSSEDDDPDTGNTGGAGNTGGTGTGGGAGSGSGGSDNNPCEGDVTTATGTPTLIDDFSLVSSGQGGQGGAGSDVGMLPENDGRAGQWAFAHYLNAAGTPAAAENGVLHFSNETADYTVAPWDPENPWEQWASATTRFTLWADPANCYDASVFTGIKFKASSASATPDKIRVQFGAPGANPDSGETFNCPEITLTASLDTYEIPFTDCNIPSWSMIADKSLPANALESIAFAVRSAEAQSGDNAAGMAVTGETLTEWDITIDDLEFYK